MKPWLVIHMLIVVLGLCFATVSHGGSNHRHYQSASRPKCKTLLTVKGPTLSSRFFEGQVLAEETSSATPTPSLTLNPNWRRRFNGFRVYDGNRLIQEEVTLNGKVRRGRYLKGDLLIEMENLGPDGVTSKLNIEDIHGHTVARYETEKARGAGFLGTFEIFDIRGKPLLQVDYEDGRIIDAQVFLAPGDKTETSDGGRFHHKIIDGQSRLEFEGSHLVIDFLRTKTFPYVPKPLYGFVDLFEGRFTGELFMSDGRRDGLTIQSHFLIGVPHGAQTIYSNGEIITESFENGWPTSTARQRE